jgi:DNA-binding protein HU-beta
LCALRDRPNVGEQVERGLDMSLRRGTVNKAQLIESLADRLGGRRAAAEAVEAVLESIQRAVAKGEKVALTGFGSFERIERAARTARNPATGATVKVKKTSVPKFRAGTGFKTVVADPRKLPKVAKAAASGGSRSTANSTATKSTGARSTAGKSTTAKSTARSTTAKSTAAKSTAAKSTARKATATKSTARKSPAKAAAKSTTAKSTAAKSTAGRKTTAKRTAKKS